MPVTVHMRLPQFELEQYDAAMDAIDAADGPTGAVVHIASEAAGGVNVCQVWHTREEAIGFVERRLEPALRAHGLRDPLAYRIEPLHDLIVAGQAALDRLGAESAPAGAAAG